MAKRNIKNANDVKTNDKAVAAIEQQHKELADSIIAAIERGEFHGFQPWMPIGNMPKSGATGNYYHGRNAAMLALYQQALGFSDNRWFTAGACDKNGWEIDADAKGVWIEKWKRVSGRAPQKDKDGNVKKDENGNEIWRTFYYMKLVGGWLVFNGDQISGDTFPKYTAPELPTRTADEWSALADEFIASSRCPIHETLSDGAYYEMLADEITLPKREQFVSNELFLRTLLHEMSHSTMVPLHRDVNYRGAGRAFEELVAEFGSIFTATNAGYGFTCDEFASATDDDSRAAKHLSYIQSWAQLLKDDPENLFRAVSKASAAADYLDGVRTGKVDPATGRKVKTEAETPETPETPEVATA